MIGFRFAGALRELPLGPDRSARFLPWVFALAVCLAGLGGAGLAALDGKVRDADQLLAATLTLQVPAGASDARLETVLALVRQTTGIAAVHLL